MNVQSDNPTTADNQQERPTLEQVEAHLDAAAPFVEQLKDVIAGGDLEEVQSLADEIHRHLVAGSEILQPAIQHFVEDGRLQ